MANCLITRIGSQQVAFYQWDENKKDGVWNAWCNHPVLELNIFLSAPSLLGAIQKAGDTLLAWHGGDVYLPSPRKATDG